MTTLFFWILLLATSFALITIGLKNFNLNKNKSTELIASSPIKKEVPNVPYQELIKIVDNAIKQELFFATKLQFEFKDIKIIDFNRNLDQISNNIMTGLSDSVVEDITYYHSKNWLMEYIVRNVEIFLTEYIKSNPIYS